jgi:pimeloyl-ACP methyl ester carboxylesterase
VWGDVQQALATTHRAISYDRRGHGRSPNGTSDMRIHARDAAALIDQVLGEPAIVVGWSGGAAVAMELIRTHPERIRAAVLIEPVFHLPRVQPRRALRLLFAFKRDSKRGRNREAATTMARFAFARLGGGNGFDELDGRQREWFLDDAEGLLRGSMPSTARSPTRHLGSARSGCLAPVTSCLCNNPRPSPPRSAQPSSRESGRAGARAGRCPAGRGVSATALTGSR